MYKFIQVVEGKNNHEFQVKTGGVLAIALIAVHLKDAEVHLRVRLVGKGATAAITGIIVGGAEEKLSLHTMQQHEAPDTTSDLLIKTVLSDHAKCLYDGGIRVEKKAQKTDAYQRNENLLLSGRAYAESKPSLEILADDVRCTHGATTGPIDDEQLWYLKTRGIGQAEGEQLIVNGFIQSALTRIADVGVRDKLQKHFAEVV